MLNSAATEPLTKKQKVNSGVDDSDVDEIQVLKKRAFDFMKQTLLHRCQTTINDLRNEFERKLAAQNVDLEIRDKMNTDLISDYEKQLASRTLEFDVIGTNNKKLKIKIEGFEKQLAQKKIELEIAAKDKQDLVLNTHQVLTNLETDFQKKLASKSAELDTTIKEKKELEKETKVWADKHNKISKYMEERIIKVKALDEKDASKTLLIQELQEKLQISDEKQQKANTSFKIELEEKNDLIKKLEEDTSLQLEGKDRLVQKLEKELRVTKTTEEEHAKLQTKYRVEMKRLEDKLAAFDELKRLNILLATKNSENEIQELKNRNKDLETSVSQLKGENNFLLAEKNMNQNEINALKAHRKQLEESALEFKQGNNPLSEAPYEQEVNLIHARFETQLDATKLQLVESQEKEKEFEKEIQKLKKEMQDISENIGRANKDLFVQLGNKNKELQRKLKIQETLNSDMKRSAGKLVMDQSKPVTTNKENNSKTELQETRKLSDHLTKRIIESKNVVGDVFIDLTSTEATEKPLEDVDVTWETTNKTIPASWKIGTEKGDKNKVFRSPDGFLFRGRLKALQFMMNNRCLYPDSILSLMRTNLAEEGWRCDPACPRGWRVRRSSGGGDLEYLNPVTLEIIPSIEQMLQFVQAKREFIRSDAKKLEDKFSDFKKENSILSDGPTNITSDIPNIMCNFCATSIMEKHQKDCIHNIAVKL